MYNLNFTGQFKKDFKKVEKSNLDIKKLEKAFEILIETGTLPVDKYKTHKMTGNYKGHFDAHIEPDWVIIWFTVDDEINLVRTGSHSELF